ncbi:MAG: hypothetical protein MI861_15580, partial [Pirellulales bacterium]|nr:hypothetical protein [Pirellulales bacterium]
MTELIRDIEHFVLTFSTDTYEVLSWWGVIVLMAIESTAIPLPSEIIMPLAGWRLVADRDGGVALVLLAGFYGAVGSLLGSLAEYYLSRAGGRPLIEKFLLDARPSSDSVRLVSLAHPRNSPTCCCGDISMSPIDFFVLVFYFVVMILIGLWAMRRVRDQEDYFMGGRGFGKLLQTFAAFGAGTGAHEPVTVGSTSWKSGLSGVWSTLMWLFVTPVYWITAVWYRRMRHMTLGDWFVERYQSQAMGAAYTVFAIVFYMVYLSTMFSAISKFAIPLIDPASIPWLTIDLQYVLIPAIALVVILYGVLGGLAAAYWTDLIQGLFIILLSVLLIPYGLWALARQFGNAAEPTLMDGFRIMHERVSADHFHLFSGPSSGEFTIQYIISLTVLALVGIVVQPHFIATGGGSAKSEDEARIGLVVGNFLKRLCTDGWALTALIALALLAGNLDIARDPDQVWGVAAREILGPLNLGLVGLMMACLLAAMMSSADTYMIVTSALVVRNIYAPYINPDGDEKQYVKVGRITGLIIIVGASVFALAYADVFQQFKMAIELTILFAAPFWVGMYWRRANRWAVWGTLFFSAMVFFVLPFVIPAVAPQLRQHPALSATTHVVTKTFEREATASDVARYTAWTAARQRLDDEHQQTLSKIGQEPPSDSAEHASWLGATTRANEKYQSALRSFGTQPPEAILGAPITITLKSKSTSLFWRGGLKPADESLSGQPELETVEEFSLADMEGIQVVSPWLIRGASDPEAPMRLLCFHSMGVGASL